MGEDEKEYARVKQYSGIIAKFSNSLTFVDDGAEWINLVRDLYGVNAEIRLTKSIRNPKTDIFELGYTGILDLSEWSVEDKKVQVKFNSSGMEQQIKSRKSQKIEIEREDTIDGKPIDPISIEQILLDGRRIFLESDFEITESNNVAHCDVNSDAGNTRSQTCGIPLKIKTNSHKGLINSVTPQTKGTEDIGDLDLMFLFDSDRDRIFQEISLNWSLSAFFQRYERIQWCTYQICLTVYENGFNFDLKNRIILAELTGLPVNVDFEYPQFRREMEGSNTFENFEVLEGESLAFECFLKADMFFANNAGVRCFAEDIVLEPIMKLKEDSVYKSSYSKNVLAHELGEHLAEIITGEKGAFISEALGRTDIGYAEDGFASLTGFAHGFWIRGFDRLPLDDEENKYRGLTTTWKDYLEFLRVAWNLNMGFETVNNKQVIRVEDNGYFFNLNVTIRLPYQVKKVKRKSANDYYFSGVEVGYPKAGEYEEAQGLDEYNAVSSFTTIITRIEKIFSWVSKIRPDSYGIEFARRKPKEDYHTEDTRYDNDIFAFDMKRFGGEFRQRKWQDDFDQEPTGTFSPETATNLRWTPFNAMIRAGWMIGTALLKYPMDYVRYASSTANSKLSTKTIGGNEYSENGNILNSELNRPRYQPEWIEFEHVVDYDIIKQVEGTSTILGKKVKNFYGLVEFLNENNDIERGFLFNLKPDKEGKWKLLKANR